LGTGSTKGSGYLDLGAAFDVVLGVNLTLHYGYQSVRNYPDLSYADYKVGLTRQFGGITLGPAPWAQTRRAGSTATHQRPLDPRRPLTWRGPLSSCRRAKHSELFFTP